MTNDCLREFDERELEKFRLLEEFPEIGIARALDYCAEHFISPPQWVVQGASDLILGFLRGDKPKQKGRLASHVARFRQELYDVERWDAVQRVQEIRNRARRDDEYLNSHPDLVVPVVQQRTYEKRRTWLKRDNFECAVDLLLGRNAYATPSAIKRSFRHIERKHRMYPERRVGAWFSDSFLQRLGLEGMQDRKPGHKTFLFIDLPKRKAKQHSAAHGIKRDRMNNEHGKSASEALGTTGG